MTLSATCQMYHLHHVSQSTIYNHIYAQPVGDIKHYLIKMLNHSHNMRVTRSKGQDRRGQIPDMVSIKLRPPEIVHRQSLGHREGDTIKGQANGGVLGALVERISRLLMFVRQLDVKPTSSLNVLLGFTDQLLSVALPLSRNKA
jgi:IS30 family transposase